MAKKNITKKKNKKPTYYRYKFLCLEKDMIGENKQDAVEYLENSDTPLNECTIKSVKILKREIEDTEYAKYWKEQM